jgi:sugar fermentation stimulation protein A
VRCRPGGCNGGVAWLALRAMRFDSPLIPGRLIRRYKRFLADVDIDGGMETVHCANPGSMLGLAEPGSPVWLSLSTNPARKLRFSWELIEVAGGLVGINTAAANRLAEEAIRVGRIAELAGYTELRREVAYGTRSRVDLLLAGPGRPPCYVEVKSVTLRRRGAAEFPDAVTARGARHLRELSAMRLSGARAVMLFIAQRGDCEDFVIARDIDPVYELEMAAARAAGVEVLAYGCLVSAAGIEVTRPLRV